MVRILFILQQVFSLWMLVDAIRRGSKYYWYFIIMMPFGEWVYFFMVKIHDPEFDPVRRFVQRFTEPKVTVDLLRYRLEQTPSYANHLALAQGLYDAKVYSEARHHFTAALRLQEGDREALWGLALTHVALGEQDDAVARLRELIERDATFRDYAAWRELAYVLAAQDATEGLYELLDRLAIKSPRLEHRVLYAHYLMEGGRRDEARQQLEEGLTDYGQAPKFIRRRDAVWKRRANKMLRDSAAVPTPATPATT